MYSCTDLQDYRIIPELLAIHCPQAARVLDCTYNTGKMWRRNPPRGLVRMDLNPKYAVDVVADFWYMPFADDAFDCVVFDPPHLPAHAATDGASKKYIDLYGVDHDTERRGGDSVASLFHGALVEARRVLHDDGVVLVKICDQVTNHRYQWQMLDVVLVARVVGLMPCDLVVKWRPNPIPSSKWKSLFHVRKNHSYWVVLRNSRRCERRTYDRVEASDAEEAG